MAGAIRTFLQAAQARRVAWRRGRNLRAAGARAPTASAIRPAPARLAPRFPALPRIDWRGASLWIGIAGVLAAGAGGAVIARHAQSLAQAVELPDARAKAAALRALPQLQAVLPGQRLSVPAGGAIDILTRPGASVLLLGAGTRASPPLRIDLCQQLRSAGTRDGALVPLRIGYSFDEVARWLGDGAAPGLRAVALGGPGSDLPKMQISGDSMNGAPLRLRWEGAQAGARWVGDTGAVSTGDGARGQADLMNDGWLIWRPDAAIHVQRQRAGAGTCRAGQLMLQVVRSAGSDRGGASGRGFVTVYPAAGAAADQPVSAWLAAGDYQVPRLGPAAAGLEDQALFEQLSKRGMLRLGRSGLAELVPRDLPAWRAAPAAGHAGQLAGWDNVKLDDGAVKLMKHLYRMADGAYVREQVRIFNGERRLLAWRMPLSATGARAQWQPADGATVSSSMPASSTRLFAAVGQGWQPWSRIDSWPASDLDAPATLKLTLAQPARAGQSLTLMLIGRAGAVTGAQLRQARAVCDGRACPARDAAQLLVLDLLPGATSVSVAATPLDMAVLAMPGDQQYRHLRVVGGQLDWLPLPPAMLRASSARAASTQAPPAIVLEDRNGAPLWAAGAPTPAASAAGLAPLLGIRADHASSVAGMLARMPSASGHHARLTLDLSLQAASQRAVDCIGMRHGSWDGSTCSGGQAPPAGRHAGMVILDTETGDILAAAGAGAGGTAVDAANWQEVRNFDRSDPARSPLRLPALQHDGGAHASPGSTFKIISALGLEQAAKSNPQIDALLGGLPLADINRIARSRGFAFQTDAAVYPMATRLAHVTNYRSQALDRRAVDGRLGLAQALTYSLNTWFAWSGELSDASLFGRADGGVPDLQPLEPGALDAVRPIVGMARRLGFGQALRLDGGLLPADFSWGAWDALQASASNIDAVHTRHELRQMAIGLRMQVTPLQMALAAAAIGQGTVTQPRLLLGSRRPRRRPDAWPAGGRAARPHPRRHEGGGRHRHRRRRLQGCKFDKSAAWPVRQDGDGAHRRRRAGHRLVHRLPGSGQPAGPDPPAGAGRLRQPFRRQRGRTRGAYRRRRAGRRFCQGRERQTEG